MEDAYYILNPWWEGRSADTGIPRRGYLLQLEAALSRRQIELVVGGRRTGKTTLVLQFASHLFASGVAARDILYLALDHPRLSPVSLSDHLRTFRGLFSHPRQRKLWLVLDEVQGSPDWEAELKALYDHENVKLVCTGSTAALLASQGGKLTGRQIVTTLYPLSFAEFLAFRGYEFSRAEEYRWVAAADEYLEAGGYPEQVLHPSDMYLGQLLDDVLARDLVRAYQLRHPQSARDLLRLLAAGIGTRTSYSRLARALGIGPDTVKEYVAQLTAVYLVSPLEKWTTSHTERLYAPRKVYFLDTGFKSLLTGKGDLGAKAENAVFADLLRRGARVGYYAESSREVDFVSGPPDNPAAVEVKYDNTFDWRDRRLEGVRMFLRRSPGCRSVTVVTRDARAELEANGTKVTAIPLWQYLLRE